MLDRPPRASPAAGQVSIYEEVEIEEGAIGKFQAGVGRKWQHNVMLDTSAPHTAARWGVSALVMITYAIRVYLINGATRPPHAPPSPSP